MKNSIEKLDSNLTLQERINKLLKDEKSGFFVITDSQEKSSFIKMYNDNVAYQQTIEYKEMGNSIVIYREIKRNNIFASDDKIIVSKLDNEVGLVFVVRGNSQGLEYFFVDLNLGKLIEAPKGLKYDSEKSNYSKNIYTFVLSRFNDRPLYFLYRIDNGKFEQKTADYLNIIDVFYSLRGMKLSIGKREYILSDKQISSLDKITELNQMEKLPTLKEIFIEYIKDVFSKNKK